MQAAEVDDLLAGRHPGIESALLRHVAPAAPVVPGRAAPVDRDLAAVCVEHSEQHAQQRRLPRPVRAEEPRSTPGATSNGDAVERDPVAERVGDVAELEPHPPDARRAAPSRRRQTRPCAHDLVLSAHVGARTGVSGADTDRSSEV